MSRVTAERIHHASILFNVIYGKTAVLTLFGILAICVLVCSFISWLTRIRSVCLAACTVLSTRLLASRGHIDPDRPYIENAMRKARISAGDLVASGSLCSHPGFLRLVGPLLSACSCVYLPLPQVLQKGRHDRRKRGRGGDRTHPGATATGHGIRRRRRGRTYTY